MGGGRGLMLWGELRYVWDFGKVICRVYKVSGMGWGW